MSKQPGIRIVKRETRNRINSDSVSVPQSDRQRERKNVDTVKGWVSEWERRKRQLQSAADALIAQCVVAARERRNPTAKMGLDEYSVVDSKLRVHGVNNLRIADGSIMSTVTTGNTQAPCVIIGEPMAEVLKAA